MDWSESKPFDSFEAKKIVHSNPKPASSSVSSAKTISPQPDQNPWNSKTPEKPMPTLQGLRNGVAALSLTEVRKVAKGQSDQDRSDIRMDPTLSSARKEKYEMMAKDFSDLEFSVRFLETGGSIPLFRNICRILEGEPDRRRFSYGHLAQLKFILPERIRIETANVCGAHSSGQDLLVTLDFGSGNSYITDVFCSRLLDFLKSHPEWDEIPEATLPEPFHQSKQTLHSNTKASNSSLPIETSPSALLKQQPVVASHPSPNRVSSHEEENTHQKPSKICAQRLFYPRPRTLPGPHNWFTCRSRALSRANSKKHSCL